MLKRRRTLGENVSNVSDYRLITVWRIEAPLESVYDAIFSSLLWPAWWPGVETVADGQSGDANGIGSIRHYTWKGPLPYRLRFAARTTRIEALCTIEAEVSGDVDGTGRWLFSHHQGISTVRYEWCVRTAKTWMNVAAPLARPLFLKSHRHLMDNGACGLARLLGARLLDVSHSSDAARPRTRWTNRSALAGAAAGLSAGIIATAAELVLWWASNEPLPQVFLQDTRRAAAIVLGSEVLQSGSGLPAVLAAATCVHVALSLCYGWSLALALDRLRSRKLMAGAVFGLLLFLVNMYGFTAVFPWFRANRDWITAAAHVVFGISAAVVYARLHRRGASGMRTVGDGRIGG